MGVQTNLTTAEARCIGHVSTCPGPNCSLHPWRDRPKSALYHPSRLRRRLWRFQRSPAVGGWMEHDGAWWSCCYLSAGCKVYLTSYPACATLRFCGDFTDHNRWFLCSPWNYHEPSRPSPELSPDSPTCLRLHRPPMLQPSHQPTKPQRQRQWHRLVGHSPAGPVTGAVCSSREFRVPHET